MPAVVEKCVNSLTAKWKADPKSRPAPRDKKQDAKSQAWAICTAMAKKKGLMTDVEYVKALADQGDGDMAGRFSLFRDLGFDENEAATLAVSSREAGKSKMEGMGPALMGLALTIRPFIKRQEQASILEGDDGRQLLRIPTMRKGMWRHPIYGKLNFDDAFFASVIKNFEANVVGQDLPVKDGHQPAEQHALGWFERVALEGKNLVVYAPPTGDEAIDLVKKKKAPYASAEFVFDYKDNELHILSFEGLEEVGAEDNDGVYEFSEDELEYIASGCDDCDTSQEVNEETTMEENENVVQLSADEWARIDQQLKALESLGNQVKSLETELSHRDERINELEAVNEAAYVAAVMDRARLYRDNDNRGHSAVFLNALEAALTLSDINSGEETVVSLADVSVEAMRDYIRGFARYLAESLPGTVPYSTETKGDETRQLSRDEEKDAEEAGAKLWDELKGVTA